MNTQQKQDQSDGELLMSFIQNGDQEAFATLVHRHASMVYGVCRRILGNHHQAEDMMQATFVLLARKAGKLRQDISAAGWLHTAARRFALNALRSQTRLMQRERRAMDEQLAYPTREQVDRNVLHRELDTCIAILPERYRVPLVLFHLEGCSLQSVAQRLKLNASTVGTRLDRARDMLRTALMRRGVAVGSVSVLVSLLSAETEAVILPGSVVAAAVKASLSGAISAPATAALKGVTTTMLISKAKLMVGGAVMAMLIGAAGTAIVRDQMKRKDLLKAPELAAQSKTALSQVTQRSVSGKTSSFTAKKVPSAAGQTKQNDWPEDPSKNFTGPVPFTAKWMLEAKRICVMSPGQEQLAAIRSALGMPISQAAYESMLKAQGYARRNEKTLINALCEAMLHDDPNTFLLWAKSTGNKKMTMNMLSGWIKEDAAAARTFALEHLSEEMLAHAETRSKEILTKTKKDTTAIKAKISRLEKNPDSSDDLHAEITKWSHIEPAEAAAYLVSLPASSSAKDGSDPDSARSRCLNRVIENWAAKDPEAALEWAEKLENEEDRMSAFVKIVPALFRKYPGEEIDFSCLPEDKRADVIRTVIPDWTVTDPASAIQFASTLEDPSLRNDCLSQTAKIWNRKDDAAAQAWVLAHPDAELRDQALSGMATDSVEGDLKQAKRLLGHMREGEMKNNTREHLVTFGLGDNKLTEVLEMANEIPSIGITTVLSWSSRVRNMSKKDAATFREWFKKTHAEGRIDNGNFGDAAWSYKTIMTTIDQAEKEKR